MFEGVMYIKRILFGPEFKRKALCCVFEVVCPFFTCSESFYIHLLFGFSLWNISFLFNVCSYMHPIKIMMSIQPINGIITCNLNPWRIKMEQSSILILPISLSCDLFRAYVYSMGLYLPGCYLYYWIVYRKTQEQMSPSKK